MCQCGQESGAESLQPSEAVADEAYSVGKFPVGTEADLYQGATAIPAGCAALECRTCFCRGKPSGGKGSSKRGGQRGRACSDWAFGGDGATVDEQGANLGARGASGGKDAPRCSSAATATTPAGSVEMRTPLRPTRTGIASPCRNQLPHGQGNGGTGEQSNVQSGLVRSVETAPTYTMGATISPQARTDPYMAPKTAPRPPRRIAATSPEGTHRTSVKDQSKAKTPLHTPSPGMSLADKLEARRLAMTGLQDGDMPGAALAPRSASAADAGHAGPPPAASDYAPEDKEPGKISGGQPQTFLLYDDGDLSDTAEEDLSDMEMWYHNKFGNSGRQDLQELE